MALSHIEDIEYTPYGAITTTFNTAGSSITATSANTISTYNICNYENDTLPIVSDFSSGHYTTYVNTNLNIIRGADTSSSSTDRNNVSFRIDNDYKYPEYYDFQCYLGGLITIKQILEDGSLHTLESGRSFNIKINEGQVYSYPQLDDLVLVEFANIYNNGDYSNLTITSLVVNTWTTYTTDTASISAYGDTRYNEGYTDGSINGNTITSASGLITTIADGMSSIFSYQIMPNVSIGTFVSIPLIIVGVIAIFKLIK